MLILMSFIKMQISLCMYFTWDIISVTHQWKGPAYELTDFEDDVKWHLSVAMFSWQKN